MLVAARRLIAAGKDVEIGGEAPRRAIVARSMPDTHADARALTAAAFTPAAADSLADAVRRTAGPDAAGVGVGTPATKDDAEFERSRERSDSRIAASRF